MEDFTSLTGTKLDLVKLELQILASKIAAVVDTLWKIRNLSITLWVGAIAVGLGNFTLEKTPIPPLLFMAAAIPACFIIADMRNNRWYRHLASRERLVQEYLASGANDVSFRPFNSAAVALEQNVPNYHWETSLFRNLADPIPLSIYGGELLFGGIAFALYSARPWVVVFPGVTVVAIVVVIMVSEFRTRQAWGRSKAR